MYLFVFLSHPSGGKVGVLGDVGKVLELQSLSGRCVAHGDLVKKVFFLLTFVSSSFFVHFAAHDDLPDGQMTVKVGNFALQVNCLHFSIFHKLFQQLGPSC